MMTDVIRDKLIKAIRTTFCNNCTREIDEFEITVEQAKQILNEDRNAILLDVRSIQEYNEGHIPGAIVISEYELQNNVLRVIANKDQTICAYCNIGERSKNAVKLLRKLGYNNSYSIMGGLENWN